MAPSNILIMNHMCRLQESPDVRQHLARGTYVGFASEEALRIVGLDGIPAVGEGDEEQENGRLQGRSEGC